MYVIDLNCRNLEIKQWLAYNVCVEMLNRKFKDLWEERKDDLLILL